MTTTISTADLKRRMHGAVEALKHDLGGLRTGRASTALLDPVHVEVYGANMPLNQVATVSTPEARMLSVQVWDRSNVQPVEKAIRSAGLGLNPITDGQMIRLPIPELTEERRKELAKLVGQYAEKARIAVRNVRRDGMDHLKQDEKKHEISEDERKRLEHEVQKLTDDTISEIDEPAADQGTGNPRQVSRIPAAPEGVGRLDFARHKRKRSRATSQSSWTAMAAGPKSAACRGSPDTAPVPRPCASAIQAAADRGVEVLTLYAFSSENWRRSAEEIADLTALMRFYLDRELATLEREGVRLKLIGDYSAFGPELVKRLERAVERTSGNRRLTLVIALNYGSQRRDRSRRAIAWRPRRRQAKSIPRASTSRRSPRSCRPATCPSSTCSSALRARFDCRISCCGRRLMPNCCSSTRCGPTSTKRPSPRRSTAMPPASGVSAAGERASRPDHCRRWS